MSKTNSSNGGGRVSSIRKFFGFLGAQFPEKEPKPPVAKRAMTQDEAVNQVNDLSKWLLVMLVILGGYGVGLLITGGRYQALCQLSYWSAPSSEIRSCNEIKSELTNYK